MTFSRFPVVHLQGQRLQEFPGESPFEALPPLAKKAGSVYLVDADGLLRNKADLDTLRETSNKGPVWADAGSRYATDVMDLFVAGAERVTVRWNTVNSFKELEEAAGFAEQLFLGVEFRGGFIDNKREPAHTPEALFHRAEELGLGLVLIDLLAGAGGEVDRALAAAGARFRGEKWYAGGRGSAYDRETLEGLAYSGILVPARAMEREPQ